MPDSASFNLSANTSDFERKMKSAGSAVKMLDAQLKLNAAQYKATGDAQTYTAERARILAEQISAQETEIEMCSRALDQMAANGEQATAKYTKLQTALAKAQTNLVTIKSAATGVGDELVEVADSATQTSAALQSIDNGVKLSNARETFEKIDGFLTSILKKAVEVGKAFWNWGREGAQWGDDLATRAEYFGVDTETIQRYDVAAKAVETDIETIYGAVDKLLKHKSAYETAAAKGQEAMMTLANDVILINTAGAQVGVQVRDASGEMLSGIEIFWNMIDALQSITNETERNEMAQELLGKSYRELIPTINKGREAFEAAAQSADFVPDENIDKLVSLQDRLDEFDQKLNVMKMNLISDFAPALEQIAAALSRMMDKIDEWAKSEEGQEAIRKIGAAFANLIDKFADGGFEDVMNVATKAVEGIADFLEEITSGEMLEKLKWIGISIGAWKLSSSLTKGLLMMRGLGLSVSGSGVVAGGSLLSRAGALGASITRNALPIATLGAMANDTRATDIEGTSEYWIAKNLPWLSDIIEGSDNGFKRKAAGETRRYSLSEAADEIVNGLNKEYALDDSYDVDAKYRFAYLAGAKYMTGNKGKGYWDEDVSTPETIARALEMLTYQNEYRPGWYNAGDLMTTTTPIDTFNSKQVAQRAFIANATEAQWDEFAANGYQLTENLFNQMSDVFQKSGAILDAISYTPDEAGYTSAGEAIDASVLDGINSQLSEFFSIGASIGAALSAGIAANINVPSIGGNTVYNSQNINNVNVIGSTPSEFAQVYQQWVQQQQAGYGG